MDSIYHGVDARKFYCIGVYTVSPVYPFESLRYAPVPLMWPDLGERPGPHAVYAVFPGGVIWREGQWHAAYGYYDHCIRVVSIQGEGVEGLLERLTVPFPAPFL